MTKLLTILSMTMIIVACGSDNESADSEGAVGIIEEQQNDAESNDVDSEQDDLMKGEGTDEYSCDMNDHPKVGQFAVFTMYYHQVAGQAQIIDNCTIEVTSFTYDGQGPDVLFYGGINGDYDNPGAGFAISGNLNGREYDNETLTIKLKSAMYLDQMNGISVWCADVGVSFGDGVFQ